MRNEFTLSYLMGVSQVGFVLLKPKSVHYSSIQRDHQYHWDYAGNEEPGGTVGFAGGAIRWASIPCRNRRPYQSRL